MELESMNCEMGSVRWLLDETTGLAGLPILCIFPGGVLPIMAYTWRLRLKGVPFSGFRYKKG